MRVLRTFKLQIAYDGTDYAGWQIQPNQPTIQSQLEKALRQLTGQRLAVVGSGRTDSGVHAIAQVGSLTTDTWRAPADALMRAMNTKLPADIAITGAWEMPLNFHAIRDAVGKRYRYQWQLGGVRDAFEYRYRLHVQGAVDVEAMRAAAKKFVGKHDFASFQATGSVRKTTVRDVRAVDIIDDGPLRGRAGGQAWAIEIEADGFLYNMVRNIVGTLLEVGRGKQSPEWIEHLLAVGDRDQAGPTAPPQGLFLARVDYDVQPLGEES
ncbi:tRNA pseudouridine(38-40) synthase TruA [Roseimaritima ulvae]|uniref:tRNA pseudouridine synthase A n=1 Tax=Roseimaritima ulvae TaxID=980254 RepID=A0A5B9QYI0_9BACT|nr:tRNA pseudouridine(38-40) synthase TruA [Roseimaritima ulvae]QEG42969.1 tRNA pseudouridine synthase A [Roseimaritima ulvae]